MRENSRSRTYAPVIQVGGHRESEFQKKMITRLADALDRAIELGRDQVALSLGQSLASACGSNCLTIQDCTIHGHGATINGRREQD